MSYVPSTFQQEIDALLTASFTQQEPQERIPTGDEQGEGIHVDKYTLPNGDILLRLPTGEAVLVPGNTNISNPLESNAIESVASLTQDDPITETNTPPLLLEEKYQEEAPQQDVQLEPAVTGTKRRVRSSLVLVPLLLLCILSAGATSSFFLLPLAATATITITPKVKSLHTDTTFTIAANPKAGFIPIRGQVLAGGQIQGRSLVASSFTRSITVPATGHAHNDATAATGVLTFYNADSQGYTIPTGTSFTVQGLVVVTDNTVTIQAVVPPMLGTAYASAHVIQVGTVGNLPAHSIYTRCCGSAFLTATNTSPFRGGQDAKDYSYIQSSDIQNAATDLLGSLTPQATAALNKEARTGEQLVTPLCSPRTQESVQPGTVSASVTVSVTQTCTSVAYTQDSLQQVATSTLAHVIILATYEQVGTTQVTVNGSTYANHTATLKVSLSGVWVYRFTKTQLAQLTHHIAGESQEQAKATLERGDGVAQVSIHVQRLDFRSNLPTNPQHISVQFFYIVS